ncbi:hypothetical protein BLS_001782 [Venturia inaequalis]|uniref:Uncharacterized protein n=1 Tax=Venturia inaequalis TaxID=5025 RepID=A0A8H3U224_VENIN|nr:hypothetical protein BLS_001782 [Venturia inaequalis]
MPPKKVKPTRPISTSALHLDVLHKPPRAEVSNLGLIQTWLTRKALIELHPVAIELYGEGGAAYRSLLASIQHVIKTELEQEAKPPKANHTVDNKAPENTKDDEDMDDEDSQDEADENRNTLPNLSQSQQTVAVLHPSSLIPETPVSAPKPALKRKRPTQIETPSVVVDGGEPKPKRMKKPTTKVTETAENLAMAAERRARDKEDADERQRLDDIKAAALVRLQGRTFVGLVGPEALECAPHEELVVATSKDFRKAIMVLGKLRTCFFVFKKDKDE